MTNLIDTVDQGKRLIRRRITKSAHKISHLPELRIEKEIEEAYDEKTRNLNFLASNPVTVTELYTTIKSIGKYNTFQPRKVSKKAIIADPQASIWVGREGSPVLYIRPGSDSGGDRLYKTFKDYADEVGFVSSAPSGQRGEPEYKPGTLLRVWWD